ncbi:UvrABC system protein B [Botrimarina hoheduenensis]|uniref:UvrABC system protein B n=2 Tax=Botrimarina hoheduenensis TaxID=2528000 RepID=A0A5C5VY16_9BACT|nr:UvrABC system protein B [Botrimarina hoheduenensis]
MRSNRRLRPRTAWLIVKLTRLGANAPPSRPCALRIGMPPFQLTSDFKPAGDQPAAIKSLVDGLKGGRKEQVLMGVTGSGKTFTMANVIQELQRPALVLSHNKTLAAQLYSEFREFFPNNAVSYFVSYYDYYQPEAYIPQRDIYIEKDASINEEIDRMRLATTSSLVSRRDVIVVASVSCIYGLGSPEDYKQMMVGLAVGDLVDRDEVLAKLIDIQYDRNDLDPERGKFRVRGDSVEIWPAYEEFAYRIEFWGDEVEKLSIINPTSGQAVDQLQEIYIYPAKHFVLPEERIAKAIDQLKLELSGRLEFFKREGKLLEAQRLNARTRYDIEMMLEMGYCPGIENYSAPLSGKTPGEPPNTLFDFFPKDYLLFVDESHATVSQVGAMYNGDRARKTTLVEHGFRLPSALDNRPLKFDEWQERINQCVYVSATPADYELERTGGEVVEQIVRPTGLLDPVIELSPARGQVPHLLGEIRQRVAAGERVLVTTLTKRLAEDLSGYLADQGVLCKWLHSELDAFERVELLRDLRQGKFDCLVGVNLLREGLDLPEVSLVAILDADKEGFLRSETSLMQTIGRAARNVNSKVILYGDKVTGSMQRAIDETDRRRKLQEEYNRAHNITPETIKKAIRRGIESDAAAHARANAAVGHTDETQYVTQEYLNELEKEMYEAADQMEFERAAILRDRIEKMQESIGMSIKAVEAGLKKSVGKKGRRGKGGTKKAKVPRPKKGV